MAAVLVHGSLVSGRQHWSSQQPLGKEGYELIVVDRRGYGDSPAVEGEDFLGDADDIAQLLAEHTPRGAHLVGDSYGAIAALYAANQRPELVRSLTVLEPPAFGIIQHPACRSMVTRMRRVWEQRRLDDRTFLEEFMKVLGEDPSQVPEQVMTVLVRNVGLLRGQRPVWEADPPMRDLATHGLPGLVVSGGHHDAFEAVCDRIAHQLGAQRQLLQGAGHEIATLGDRLNAVLLQFWNQVEHSNG